MRFDGFNKLGEEFSQRRKGRKDGNECFRQRRGALRGMGRVSHGGLKRGEEDCKGEGCSHGGSGARRGGGKQFPGGAAGAEGR